jgi:hypothetical protein
MDVPLPLHDGSSSTPRTSASSGERVSTVRISATRAWMQVAPAAAALRRSRSSRRGSLSKAWTAPWLPISAGPGSGQGAARSEERQPRGTGGRPDSAC